MPLALQETVSSANAWIISPLRSVAELSADDGQSGKNWIGEVLLTIFSVSTICGQRSRFNLTAAANDRAVN